jgi:formylglycine-generating enzyme required for sulfatase activity
MICNNKQFILSLFWLFGGISIFAQPITETIPGTEVTFQMTLIPAGTFEMNSSERTQSIKLDAFYIGTHEVTWDEFLIFHQRDNDNDKSHQEASVFNVDAVTRPTPMYEDFSKGMGKRGGFPAVSMTQQAALRYCEWLYQKTGNFYRLPTEAEWEYACRGGTKTDFHFGNEAEELENFDWYYENGDEKYHKVGEKKPNAWGLFDMHGNVSEWTLDDYVEHYFGQFEESVLVNPWVQPKMRHYRTVKGGSYYTDAEECSCSFRLKSKSRWQMRDPQIPKSLWWNTDSPFVGFRLVKPTQEMTSEAIEAFFKKAIID